MPSPNVSRANVIAFPCAAPPAMFSAADDHAKVPHAFALNPARREYSLADVARLTGLAHVSHKALIATLRKLAVQAAMPLPKTPRIHAGRLCTGPAMIGVRSRWDALRFDDWLDDRTGPPGGACGDPDAARAAGSAASASTREAMAARAAVLAQSGRKRA